MIHQKNAGEQLTEKLVELLQDVLDQHRFPDNGNYNDCDKEPCQWCIDAKEFINAHKT